MTVYEPPSNAIRSLTVRALVEDADLGLSLAVVAGGSGLDRPITHHRIQKSGLALVGHPHGIVPTRIQILGETEISYIESLSPAAQVEAVRHLFALQLSLVVVTRGVSPPSVVVDEATRSGTPLAVARERSSQAITAIHAVLDERLAPRARVHGVLVDVFEVGVLLLGKSGIGKSECALDLIERGHRLVADDIVEIRRNTEDVLIGGHREVLRHHLEIRGVGVIDVQSIFGIRAIRMQKRVELEVQLQEWDDAADYERMGLEDRSTEILGVRIPQVIVPLFPGKNITVISEVIALNFMLKIYGYDAAQVLNERILQSMRSSSRLRDYLEQDRE